MNYEGEHDAVEGRTRLSIYYDRTDIADNDSFHKRVFAVGLFLVAWACKGSLADITTLSEYRGKALIAALRMIKRSGEDNYPFKNDGESDTERILMGRQDV